MTRPEAQGQCSQDQLATAATAAAAASVSTKKALKEGIAKMSAGGHCKSDNPTAAIAAAAAAGDVVPWVEMTKLEAQGSNLSRHLTSPAAGVGRQEASLYIDRQTNT